MEDSSSTFVLRNAVLPIYQLPEVSGETHLSSSEQFVNASLKHRYIHFSALNNIRTNFCLHHSNSRIDSFILTNDLFVCLLFNDASTLMGH